MAKTRIEVNEAGELFTLIPEDIIQELMLEEGEQMHWEEDAGLIEITLG